MMAVIHVVALSLLFALLVPRKAIWVIAAVAAAIVAVLTATPIELRFWSAVGTPSITALALLFDVALWRHGTSLLSSADRRLVLTIAAACFLILEPAALGFVPLDLYRLGFSPVAPLLIAIVSVILLTGRRPATACVILAALIAFDVRLLGSSNLWDYLVDPIVGAVAVIAGAKMILRARTKSTAPVQVTAPVSSDRRPIHTR
jgi:hypothetical protein